MHRGRSRLDGLFLPGRAAPNDEHHTNRHRTTKPEFKETSRTVDDFIPSLFRSALEGRERFEDAAWPEEQRLAAGENAVRGTKGFSEKAEAYLRKQGKEGSTGGAADGGGEGGVGRAAGGGEASCKRAPGRDHREAPALSPRLQERQAGGGGPAERADSAE
mmetsp:Transcript_90643/g.258966  ORF Transcript_90643/g.258966 Transcript_90643/m.258966 type:complete len:161 (+) Transcript_90643:489-971(+)